jgi:putative peptidoglycan lipid II flippase
LVAWTVPETAEPLLIESAMAFLFVPVFSHALATGRSARDVVAGTLPRVFAALLTLSAATAGAAPWLVHVLAPGLTEPGIAVLSMRLISVTILTMGLTGYVCAALRAHDIFGPPAAIYMVFNTGVILMIVTLHGRLGVLAATIGMMLGSTLMLGLVLPSFLRHIGLLRQRTFRGASVTVGLVFPLAAYTLCRQAQVYVERFFGSALFRIISDTRHNLAPGIRPKNCTSAGSSANDDPRHRDLPCTGAKYRTR